MSLELACDMLSLGPTGPPESEATTVSSMGAVSGSVNLQLVSFDVVWKVYEHKVHRTLKYVTFAQNSHFEVENLWNV